MEEAEIKKIEKSEEREENDDVQAILAKAVVLQALYGVLNDEYSWEVMVMLDDLAGFGKTVIPLPKTCLNKEEFGKYIEEIKKKKV
jgi:hypothetical protein